MIISVEHVTQLLGGRKFVGFLWNQYKGNAISGHSASSVTFIKLLKQKQTHKNTAHPTGGTASKNVGGFMCWLSNESAWAIDDIYSQTMWEEVWEWWSGNNGSGVVWFMLSSFLFSKWKYWGKP
jgi:hypothetical protein